MMHNKVVIYFCIVIHIVSCLKFPVLDLSLPLSDLAIPFENALKMYGFFYIKNHGISTDILNKAFNESLHFFEQSLEFKKKYSYNNNRGYIKLSNKSGQIGFDGLQTIPDQKEGFVLMSPEYNINKPFYGKNKWPQIDKIDDDNYINQFKYIFEEYKDEMNNLNMKLIQIFALSLGLSQDYFFNGDNMLFVADQLLEIALWHYIPLKSNIKNGIYACGEHSDWNLFSILAIDGTQGLQVKLDDNNWYDMEYKENVLIVNSGNMAEVITNRYYKSSYHRVLLQESIDRYSIVYFISPNYEWKLKCIGKICNQQNKEKINEQDTDLNAGQYLAKMFEAHTIGYSLKPEL